MAVNFRRSAFTESDLIGASSIAVKTGQFNKLGEYQVEAGEVVAIGYGAQSGQDNAQGRFYLKLNDGTNDIHGEIRISANGPQNNYLQEIGRWRTEALGGTTDRTKQIPLPLTAPGLSEDKKFILEFNPDADGTVSKANSDLTIDISRHLT